MFDDKDIKIVGDRPSDTVKIHRAAKQAEDEFSIESANGNLDRARALGKAVAEKFCEAGNDIMPDGDSADNTEMLIQRQQLLAFGVKIGFERFCPNDILAETAWSSFEKQLGKIAPSMQPSTTDTGAFSFYFLAYRRGGDIERRIGQTFAMLCSHDGDPIYQELGEALYCWFTSFIKTQCESANFQ